MNRKTEVMKMAGTNKTEMEKPTDAEEMYKKQMQAYEDTIQDMNNKISKLVDLYNTLFQKYLGE